MKLPGKSLTLWLMALVIGVTASFAPALHGGFLFDDFANLKALGEYGPVQDIAGLARYLSMGIADPLGRPVAMASFLLDARDWPAEPGPFLRGNLILHAINSLLLALLLAGLGRLRGLQTQLSDKAAIAGAALWALHPLWVSTVGYVVQRHAMLAAFFVLLGALCWLVAIGAFRKGLKTKGWLWAGIAMPICGVLAALSKANGVLLPLLVLVLHYFVIHQPADRSRSESVAVRLLLVFPSVLLIAGLLAFINPEAPGRPWSLADRLMSQPRALADYLWHLVVPRVNSAGVFADGFEVSTSWTSPATTLPAAIFLLVLLIFPFVVRRKNPILAGAVAFFLAAHVMESSVLPLELYFEHRNYLPAMLLGWPLALHLLAHPWQARTGKPILVILVAVLALTTFQRAALWADQPRQAAVWGLELPDSPRAQTWAAQHEIERGQLGLAHERLEVALKKNPDNAMLALNLLDIECAADRTTPLAVKRATKALANARTGVGDDMVHSWLRRKLLRNDSMCPQLDMKIVDDLLNATAASSAGIQSAHARHQRLEGISALTEGRCADASRLFLDAHRSQRWPSEAYADAALLASRCGPQNALTYLESFEALPGQDVSERPGMLRVHQWVLRRQDYWPAELRRLEKILRSEVAGDASESGETK